MSSAPPLTESKNASLARRANPVDREIGNRIRQLREQRRITQEALGGMLDPPITFQQIQKYENALNRVAGSRMKQIADALGVTVGVLHGEMQPPRGLRVMPEMPQEHLTLLLAFEAIESKVLKEHVITTVLAAAGMARDGRKTFGLRRVA